MILGPRTLQIPLLLGAFVAPSALQARDDKRQAAEALLAKARELSDIRCEGCPPFRLVARVRFSLPNVVQSDGEYVLLWASHEQWREEMRFPDFTQQTYGSRLKVWRVRSISY